MIVSVAIALYSIKRMGDSNRNYIEAVRQSSQTQIDAIKKASQAQITQDAILRDSKRKQLLRALIRELRDNLSLYEIVTNKTQNIGSVPFLM